jgi:hypothetical protein
MKNFTFKILDRHPRLTHKTPYTIGQITINDFEEEFDMPIDWWQEEDYEKQWVGGFEYLKKNGKACFITKIFRPTSWQCVECWIAHKIENKIRIQNQAFMDRKIYKKICGNQWITLENWFNFIPLYEPILLNDEFTPSEWTVDIEE